MSIALLGVGALLSPLDDAILNATMSYKNSYFTHAVSQSKFSFLSPSQSKRSLVWAARRNSEDLRGRRIIPGSHSAPARRSVVFEPPNAPCEPLEHPRHPRRARTRRGISDIGSDSAARSASPTAADDDIV